MRTPIKVNATLTRYIIHDLSTILRTSFKFSDRMTSAEAKAIQSAFAKSTELRKALAETEALPGGKKLVSIYRDVLRHYVLEHKADAAGDPVAWDVPAFTGSDDPSNPFKGMHPEHARTILEWAETRPDYGKIRLDRHHIQHAAIEEQTRHLHEAASARPPAAGASAQPPAPAAQPAASAAPGARAEPAGDRAATIRGLLLKTPKTDPQRRALFDELLGLTQAAPAAAGAPAASSALPATPPPGASRTPQLRLAELQQHPAYRSKSHPEHEATVEAVSAVFREMHPEPPRAA